MFENSEKLIIVHDEKTTKYAEMLVQLIGTNDDTSEGEVGIRDGSVEAVTWLEKQYTDNRPTISSKSNVLYIGNNKVAKSQRLNINIEFDKFGMKYGWIGNRAILYVDNHMMTVDEYQEFYEFCKKYELKAEKLLSKASKEKKIKEGALAAAEFLGLGLIGVGTIGAARLVLMKNKIREQQYTCLILAFYLDGLKSFLED